MDRLAGKTVVITGASRGIGAAAAEAMAAEGASLMLLARASGAVDGARRAAAGREGARAEAMACDVADFAQVRAAVDRARADFGRIDALINNAGVIEPIGPLAAADPAAWAAGGRHQLQRG